MKQIESIQKRVDRLVLVVKQAIMHICGVVYELLIECGRVKVDDFAIVFFKIRAFLAFIFLLLLFVIFLCLASVSRLHIRT